jgi:hypothetical protein
MVKFWWLNQWKSEKNEVFVRAVFRAPVEQGREEGERRTKKGEAGADALRAGKECHAGSGRYRPIGQQVADRAWPCAAPALPPAIGR